MKEIVYMFYDNKGKKEQNADSALLSGLTRRQLKELEEKEKTPAQKLREAVIMLLPLRCAAGVPAPAQQQQERKALELCMGARRGDVRLSALPLRFAAQEAQGRKADV